MNNHKNSFEQMLDIILETQTPHIVVYCVEDEYWSKPAMFNYIILPDSVGKTVKLSFLLERGSYSEPEKTSFLGVDILNMNLEKAIVHYSREVLKNQGAVLKLIGC